MTCAHFFLAILLVSLLRLDGAQEPCPPTCHCTEEILNCSRITGQPGFHRVPLPKLSGPPHPIIYLDFTGNEISSVGKEAWKAYPWAEYLVLKDNSLSKLQNSSLEGLLSLVYLDLSCNKIQTIETNAFEAVPFLQVIDLSGNVIERISYGTFRAWHGMQFLHKIDLSHNPLGVIQDPYFYKLPLLKLLDLGATEVTPKILEGLLQTSLRLRTLFLPQKMSCCLCRIKEDIEVLCETVKLECTEPCDINATVCKKEKPLRRIQGKVMKALEVRKMNGSSLLTILPERAVPNNTVQERTEPSKGTPVMAQNYSSLVKQLMQEKADEPLDVNWADKDELKKLYLLASLLKAALKETIVELEKNSPNELSAEVSEKSTDEATKTSTDASLRKERHVRKVVKENWFGGNQRQKVSRVGRDGRQVAVTATQSADQPSVFELRNEAGSRRKLAKGLDPQRALPFLRSRPAALQPSWKRSIPDSLINVLELTRSTMVDKNDDDLSKLSSDGNSAAVLGDGSGAQTLTEEELLNHLQHTSNPPATASKSQISAPGSEPSLNELLPDITLSHGTYWEHQRTSVPPLPNLAPQDDFLLQGDLFEDELRKQLASLVPNAPVRKLISHVIRTLKMDCTAPTLQVACVKLISRTGLLMKLFSENTDETSALWKSYFWPSEKVASVTTAISRKLETPLGKTGSQGIPTNGYGNKLLLAISATAIIMIIIAAVFLIEICSQRSAAKARPILGKPKKSLADLESSRPGPLLVDKPLWLQDMYQHLDDMQTKNMADKLHDEESSEEVDVASLGKARPSSLKKSSSKSLAKTTDEMPPDDTGALPPPVPPAPPSEKSSARKGSDATGGTSAATLPQTISAAADKGEEDEEGSSEKSDTPTTVATSEAPESGEVEADEEEEEAEAEEDEESD